jgi:methionyl-tRNA formyltransferase
LKKTGWQNFVYKIVTSLWVYFAEFLHKMNIIKHCITPSNLAKRYNIEILRSQDCNDELTLNYLKDKNIDILLSINVYQRMLEPLLALPRIAAVNNHFGLLPKYRGMAPYIWAMANGEKEIGLSVHHMVLQFDEGKLIRQEKMPLKKGDSAMGVYIRGCMISRSMICEAVARLQEDPSFGYEQVGGGSYYSMPTRECIRKLRNNGFSLWRVRDLFAVLRTKIDGIKLP